MDLNNAQHSYRMDRQHVEPVAGCTILSSGYTNCYAMRMEKPLELMERATNAGVTGSAAQRRRRRSTMEDLDCQLLQRYKTSLDHAIERHRSDKWVLFLWSRLIKARDQFRCVSCGANKDIQSHHIIRKCLLQTGALDTGNGITLCRECHRRVHDDFNRRPDLSQPINAQGGDCQDEWAFLFGLLCDDAAKNGLNEEEFYRFSDEMVYFSLRAQGCHELYDMMLNKKIGRLRFMHEIWRQMPEQWYTGFVAQLIALNTQNKIS